LSLIKALRGSEPEVRTEMMLPFRSITATVFVPSLLDAIVMVWPVWGSWALKLSGAAVVVPRELTVPF
jgi:hypothetical protein